MRVIWGIVLRCCAVVPLLSCHNTNWSWLGLSFFLKVSGAQICLRPKFRLFSELRRHSSWKSAEFVTFSSGVGRHKAVDLFLKWVYRAKKTSPAVTQTFRPALAHFQTLPPWRRNAGNGAGGKAGDTLTGTVRVGLFATVIWFLEGRVMFHPLVYSSGAQPRNGRGEGLCAAAFGYSMRRCSVQTANKGGLTAQPGNITVSSA